MNDKFLRQVVWVTIALLFLLLCGIFFGPWEIDPHAPSLLALLVGPGSTALGALLKGRKSDDDG